jgi:hypothetical protein
MGYILQEQILVATGWDLGELTALQECAVSIFGSAHVTRLLPSIVNGHGYFMVGGCGSKFGVLTHHRPSCEWKDADDHLDRIQRFTQVVSATRGYSKVVQITIGEDREDLDVTRLGGRSE